MLGFLIGIIPGSAHVISSFVSYGIERRLSKHPERFGKGAIEGVAGPESANNAAATGAFVPMMALGIPTGPVTAVMIAAVMVHGISPGPMLIQQQPELFWGFVASMYVGNTVLLILNLPMVGLFVNLLRIPYAYLYPAILCFCILGCYSVSNSVDRRVDHADHGRHGLRAAEVRLRSRAGGAGTRARADARAFAAPVARDERGRLFDLPAAPDRADDADPRARAAAPRIEAALQRKKDWRAKVGLDEQ